MEIIQSTFAEINLDNLLFNFSHMKADKHKDKKICCVIKANAYGHGYEMIAKTLEEGGVDYFATSSLQEALLLKESVEKTPVMVLTGLIEGSEELAVAKGIETTVFNLDQARRLNEAGKKLGRVQKVHIKLDTGMNRIGFKPTEENLDIIWQISQMPNLDLHGIFTHFASADMESDYTKTQAQCFYGFLDKLEARGISFPLIHMDNDAGAMMYNHKAHMIRLGIGLYGVYPSAYVKDQSGVRLKPLMSLKSRISNVKTIEKGQAVSYACTYKAKERVRLATIGAGYADGVPRLLSNKGYLLIEGEKCPIVGNVCMDQLMVDIKNLDLKVGDVVEIFGEVLSVDEIAQTCMTISYEILSNIGVRVPRIYIRNGEIIGERWYLKDGVK